MKVRSIFNLTLILGLLMAFGCSKEPLTVEDAIELGELDDKNYVQLKEGVIILDDPDVYVQVDSNMIVLDGSINNYDSIHIGDVVCKFSFTIEAPFTYHRKVVDMYEIGDKTMIETIPAGIPDVFKRLNLNSQNKDDDVIMFRTDVFSYGFAFKPASPINIQEVKGYVDPDIDFTYTYDTSQSVFSIVYDEILGITPQIVMEIKDLEYEGTFKICLNGQVAGGYKNDKIIPQPLAPCTGFVVPVLSAVGLVVYFNPKTEVLLKVKGEVCSNTITFSAGPYTYSASINLEFPFLNMSNIEGNPVPTIVTTDPWSIAGSGTLEAFGGGDIYISNVGCKEVQLLKAGVTTGMYARASLKATGNTYNLLSEFKVNADFGPKAKIFFTAELFGGNASTFINNAIKGKAFWETEDIRLPLLEWDYEWSANCDKNITAIRIEPDGTNINISADCTNCGNSKYYISFNDITLQEANGELREFSYNTDYVVTPPSLYEVSNLITFQDKESTQCHYINEFQDPSFGHENCTIFEDPRDGDLYCTATIGNQTWLRENLRYDDAGGVWYNHEETVYNVFCGRLYTYEEVLGGETAGGGQIQGICPPGYHLPSSQEFETLVNNIGGNSVAGTLLKYPSPSFWTNTDLPSIGTFNAVGAGEYYPWRDDIFSFSEAFGGQTKYTYFWTSSVSTNASGTTAPIVFRLSNNSGVTAAGVNLASLGLPQAIDAWGISCRCIQD